MARLTHVHTGVRFPRVLRAAAIGLVFGQVAWGIDFAIQRGVTDITGTTATITAGVDYTAPSALSNAFIRITNTRLSGGGRTSLGGNQNARDWMVSIQNPGNLLTSITFERFNATNDTQVWWEIVEFTNTAGGPNEFVVRDQAEVNLAAGTLTTTGAVAAGIADDNDVAVFITGQRVNAGNTTSTHRGLHYSSWLGGPDQPQFDRQDATGNASRVSYAVVEFTGANWSVEYSSVDFSLVGGTSTTSTITGVGALSRTFLHVQNGATQPGLDGQGVRAWPSSATVIDWDVQVNSSQIGAAWAIGNTDTSAGQMSVQHFQTTDSTSADGAIESFAIVAVTATNASAMGESALSTGAGTASPRGSMNLRLQSGGSFYDTFESDNGQTTTYALSVVEWPEDLTPVANDDSHTGSESTDIVQPTLGVLSNDAGASPRVYRLQGTLLGGFGPLTQASSQGGSVTVTSDGAFTYDDTGAAFLPLTVGSSATDTFTYTNEALGLTDQATVTLTIHGLDPASATDDSEYTNKDLVMSVDAGSGGLLDDDTGGNLSVTGYDNPGSQGGSVTVAVDGAFTYDPTGVPAFSALVTGQTLTDTFSYFISNAEGTDTGNVTVVVEGTGIAFGDTAISTTEDATSTTPNLLTNDYVGSTLVEAFNSDLGATLSTDTAGNFTYDPTAAALLQALAAGDSTTDTFTYRSMNSAGIVGGWDLQFIDFNSSTNAINNTTEALLVHDEYDGDAEYFLASTGARYRVTTFIDRDSPDPTTLNYGAGIGSYSGDDDWPDGTGAANDALSDIVMRARVGVEIPAGTYTIAFGSDAAGLLRFQGNSNITFDSVFNHSGTGGVGTQRIGKETSSGHSWTGGVIRVTSTQVVEVFALYWERAGTDSWEVALASGPFVAHNTTDFDLLATGVKGWSFIETDSATVNVTVNGVNDAPTGTDDSYNTDENTVLTGGSGSYLDTVDADSPILHWRLDESSGLTAADVSGNNRDGLLVGNGVTFGATGGITGSTNPAYGLAGTDDFVADGDAEDYLDSLSAVSFEMWVEADAVGGTERGIFGDATSSGSDNRVGMRYDTSGAASGRTNIITMAIYNGTSSQNAESSVTVGGDAVWDTSYVHLVMTWSSGNAIRFFVNGVEDAALVHTGTNVSGTLSTSGIRLGKSPSMANEFDGSMDEFSIYATALTPAEVLAHYNAGVNGIGHNLLTNDEDPDDDTMSMVSANGSGLPTTFSSGNGAEITVAADGTFTYDPTGSATIHALETGETLTDSFTYVSEDSSNVTISLTTVIVVAGVSGIEDDSYPLDEDTNVIGSDLLGRTTTGDDNDNGTVANDHAPGIGPASPYSLEWFGNDQAADDADTDWESSARADDSNASSVWVFGGAITFATANDARLTALETAIQFPISGNGATMSSWEDGIGIGNPSGGDFSIEIVFQADNVAGNHILWETGGATDGSYIALLGNTVEARSQDSGNTAVVTSGGVISAGQFYQLFYTFEMATGTARLYLDGALIGSDVNGAVNDWAGADGAGLGRVSGSIPSPPAGLTAFDGDMALVRYYDEQVVTAADIADNFSALIKPVIVAVDGNPLVGGTVTFNTATLGVSVTLDSNGAFTYNATGAAAVQALDAGDTATDSFTYEAEQSGTSSNSGTATVTFSLTGLNDAPSVSGTGTFTSVTEDETAPAGDLLSAVLGATVSDADASAVEGVAIISFSGNGTWQYNTGSGFTTLSTVNANTALLLRDTDTIRYLPDLLNGEIATLGYHAWDQTTGTVGLTADPNPNGDTTAFSTATEAANLTVTNVNEAPILNNSGSPVWIGTDEDTTTTGQLVSAMLVTGAGGDPISDADNGAVEGIAISAISGNGTWQFDSGSGYTTFPTINANTALLLRETDSVRYVPDLRNGETAFMTFVAWDQSNGSAGQTVAPNPNGGTTAFSTLADSASLAVSSLNDAPVLDDSDAPVFTTITENQMLTETVGTMLTSTATDIVTDADAGAIEGIALIGFSGNGTWQYDTGGGFTTFSGVLNASSALLLRDSDTLRYIADGLNGETAIIIFRAWDRTAGTVGSIANPGAGGGVSSFSATLATEAAVLTVTDVNDAPSVDDSGTPTFVGTDEDTTSSGETVAAMLLTGAGTDPITEVDFSDGLSSDLLGHWKLDEAAGATVAVDSSSNGRNGTITGATAGVPGQIDTAYSFDGDDEVRIDNVAASLSAADVAGGFTISFWATTEVWDGDHTAISFWGGADFGIYPWEDATGDPTAYVWYNGAFMNIADPPTPPASAGDFSHFVYVNDGNDHRIYVNTQMHVEVLGNAISLGAITAGSIGSFGGEEYYREDIDDVRIYDRALTVGEITALYTNPEGIAIYATASNGTWQYDTGAGYTSFPTVNANSALLLRDIDSIRFAPDQQNAETALLSFYAWDQDSGAAGTRVSVATRGGSTAFSTEDEDARMVITSVNDAPELDHSGAPFFIGTDENTTSTAETVATMLARGAGGDPVSDVDNGAIEGVAITAIVGNGTWQYDTGAGFTAFPTVNVSTALLLRETDSVRYVPDNRNGEVATFDFQAWDQVTGTAGQTANPIPNGGTTAFSTNTESTFLIITSVNDAPVLDSSGAPFYTGTDENTTSPAETVATMIARGAGGDPISDVDTGASEGIAITGFSGNGTWQYDTGGGFTTLPTVNTDTALLLRDSDSMQYIPDTANGETAFLTFVAWDQTSGTVGLTADPTPAGGSTAFSIASETAFLVVTDVNDAPVIDNTDAPTFTTITEDETMTNLVATMITSTATDIITDVDNGSVEGVIVVGISGNGTWQYDTGGGLTTIPTVNASTGLLLRDSDTLHYIADTLNGETAFVTFRAWDQTTDTVGTTVTAGAGGSTAYSISSEVASLLVTDVNDAPVLDIAGQPELTTITEDETATPGDLVSAILAAALPTDTITDVDNGAVEGVAISAISGNGTWQFDTGGGFTTFPSVNSNTALVLRATDTIRYVPDTFNGETAFFTFKAWDQTTDTAGTTADPNPGGATTAYSTNSVCEVTRIIVTDVNDAPVLDPSDRMDLTTITEDDTLNTGDLISAIIASSTANGGDAITDVDNGAIEGIAIIGQNVSGTGTGTWQFSTDGGTSWINVGTVSFGQALLLRETDRLRVLPDAANSTTGTMTLHAWDQAFQAHATKVNLTFLGTGNTTAFSVAAETDVEILVTRVNDPPTITGTAGPFVINDDPLSPPNSAIPFATVTIDDIDAGPPDILSVSVTIDDCNKGSFSVLNGFTETAPLSRVYTFSGIQTAATSAIRGLVFVPTEDHHFPTSFDTTTFTIDVDDNAGGTATDNSTEVDVLSINDAPQIINTTNGQTVNDNQFLKPFEFTTITDIDNHYGLPCAGTFTPAQVLGVSVLLDDGDKGELQHRVEMPTAGLDNNIDLWVSNPNSSFNGYQVRFLSSRSDGTAGAVYDATNNRLDVSLTANVTCAFAVVDAINAVPEFSAELNNVTDLNNNGSGVVAAQSTTTTFFHLTKFSNSLYVTNTGNRNTVFSLLRILTFDPTEDRVAPPATETATLTVRMTDQLVTVSESNTTVISTSINNAPTIAEQTFTVAEDAPNGTDVTSLNGIDNITTFLGADVDPGHTAALTYALRPPGGSGAAAFAFSAAGVITVLDETLIDFETNTLFKLEVVATDPLGLSNPSYIEQKLLPCDPDTDDFFGSAVAIDGNRLVIGAKFANASGSNSGCAYVFERNGLAWRETSRLVGSSAGNDANFGSAVGVSADRIAVGAEGMDTVFVFRLSGTRWVEEAVLTGADTSGGDFFGSSLDLDGGVGDTLVVGAPLHHHNNVATSGGVYVFSRSGTTWTQQAQLVPSENAVGDLLGADVAVDGNTIAAGAPGDDTGGIDAGSVSIFFRTGVNWAEQATVQGSDSNTGDQFGAAVDLEGDFAVIGSPLEDEGGFAAGAVYIFERVGVDWNQQDKVIASDAATSDKFGANVAITEGVTPVKIAVGSPFDDDGGTDSGSVYLFEQDISTKWTQVAKEVADDAATEDRFGARVALSGKQLLIGANFAGANDEGASYVVNCDPGEICIVVVDANDPPVINDGTFTVDENSPNLTSIGTVDSSDPDVADILTHTVTAGDPSGIFALNALTGEFTVANSALLDFEATNTFVLSVQVVDSGAPSYSDTATVTITLNDVNEAPGATDGTFTVDENELAGFSFGTLNVVDQDTADSLSHTITTGNGSGAFALNINTGELTVADSAALDFEVTTQFILSILVVDNGVPALSDTASITIDVNDLNEAPVSADTSFTILETVPNLTVLGTLGASDEDVGQSITFSITAGNTGAGFSLGGASGILTVADNSGFEATGQYVLSIDISDNGGTVGPGPPLTTSITVPIDVTDVNDAPVITPIANQNVDELVALALVAGATDADLPPQNLVFSIDNATSTLGATINPSTGAFDWTPSEGQGPGVYTVSITVTDDGSPLLSATTVFDITVADVNTSPSLASIGNKSGTEGILLTFTAVGGDTDQPTQNLTYSLVGGPVGASILGGTGVFSWTPNATQGSVGGTPYTMSIVVTDDGSNPANLASSEQITVTVFEPGAAVGTSVVWTNVLGIDVQPNNDLERFVLDEPGENRTFHSGAISVQCILGDNGFVETTVDETSSNRMFGLSDDNDQSLHFSDIKYALFLDYLGMVTVYESGSQDERSPARPYVNGDILRVEIIGTLVHYSQNGVIFYTSTRPVIDSDYPFKVDVSMQTDGGTLRNVVMSVQVPASPKINSFAAEDPLDTDDSYGTGDTLKIGFDIPTNTPGGAGVQNKTAVDSLFQFNTLLGTDYQGQWQNVSCFVVTILDPAGHSGVAVDTTTVEPLAGGTAILDATAASAASTRVSGLLTGDFGTTSLGTSPVNWQNLIRATATPQSNDLTETTGNDLLYGAAVSVETFAWGDITVEFVPEQTDAEIFVGLTSLVGNNSALFQDIRFAANLRTDGTFGVSELPHFLPDYGIGRYVAGDRIKVAITGSTVTYYVNDILRYTSTTAVTPSMYPFTVDVAVGTGTITNVRFNTGADTVAAPPLLTSVIASDPSGDDRVLDIGDIITLNLSTATNQPGGAGPLSATAIADLFTFSDPISSNYVGGWTTPSAFTITVTDTTNSGLVFDQTAIVITGTTAITNLAGTSGNADPTYGSVLLDGNFGAPPLIAGTVVWENIVNATDSGGGTLTKTSTANAWNAYADSTHSYLFGDIMVEMTVSPTLEARMFGLNRVGEFDHPDVADFGIKVSAFNTLHVIENLTDPGSFGSVRFGDVLRIEISNGQVLYKKNDEIFYTSTVTLTDAHYPLEVVGAIFSANGILNGVSASAAPSAFPPEIDLFEANDPDDGDKIYSNDDTLKIRFDKATAEPGGAGVQAKTAIDNLFTFSVSLGSDYQGEWTSASCFQITLLNIVAEGGVTIGQTTVTPAGGTPIVDTTLPASPPASETSPLLSGDLGDPREPGEDVVWTNLYNVTAIGNDLCKPDHSVSELASGAVSVQEISRRTRGTAYLEFDVDTLTHERVVGFTMATDITSRSQIEFGVFMVDQRFFIIESGVIIGQFGTYNVGEIIRIEYTDTQQIRYYVDSLLRYTSAVTINVLSDLPLRASAYIESAGAKVVNARVSFPPAPIAFNQEESAAVDFLLRITMDRATDVAGGVGVHAQGTVDQLWSFTETVGASYSGEWTTASVYCISVTDETGSLLEAGVSTVTALGTIPILDDTPVLLSPAANGTSPLLIGPFDETEDGRPIVWSEVAGSTVGADNTLTKTAPTGPNNAGARSAGDLFFGDGFLTFEITQTNRSYAIGWANSDPDDLLSSIDFAFYVNGNNANIAIFESGVTVGGSFGTVTPGDIFRIELSGDGGRVIYKKNGVTIYTSLIDLVIDDYPFHVDAVLETSGAQLNNVRVSISTDNQPVIKSFSVRDPDDSDSVYSNGDVFEIKFDRLTDRAPNGDGNPVNAAGVDDLFGIANVFTVAENFGNDYQGRWVNASCYEITALDVGDSVGIEISQLSIFPAGFTPILDAAATSTPSERPSAGLIGSFGLPDQVVWTDHRNVSINGTNLEKIGQLDVASDWSAGAHSTVFLTTGLGWLETRVEETDNTRMIGWTSQPTRAPGTTNHFFTTIDYAAFLNNSELWLWVAPGRFIEPPDIDAGPVTLSPNDIIRIEINSLADQVRWLVNGNLVHTLGSSEHPALNFPMRVRASLEQLGATIKDVSTSVSSPQVPVLIGYQAISNGSGTVEAGDVFHAVFDIPTNQPFQKDVNRLETSEVDGLFHFNGSIGAQYDGVWTSATIFSITVLDPTGADVQIGISTIKARALSPEISDLKIRNAAETSKPADTISPALTGAFRSAIDESTSAGAFNEPISAALNVLTLTLLPGWNLVSLPASPLAPDVGDIFGTHVTGAVLTWQDGDFLEAETIEPGVGYWLYHGGDGAELTIPAAPTVALQTDLSPGWNLIGVSQAMALPADLRVLYYQDNAFTDAESLEPYKGYWVYSD